MRFGLHIYVMSGYHGNALLLYSVHTFTTHTHKPNHEEVPQLPVEFKGTNAHSKLYSECEEHSVRVT